MIDFLQSADDSDGEIGSVIESCLETISELAQDRHSMPAEERMKMFRRLLEETKKPYYDGWTDWSLALLEAAGGMADSEDMQLQWDEAADFLLMQQSGKDWNSSYAVEQIMLLRYGQIVKRSGEDRAKEFLYDHLHIPKMREVAVRKALEQGDYEEAIRLAEGGEARDHKLPGLVHQWKKYRYEAYRQMGLVEQQRKLGMELILKGELECCRSVKDTFSDEEEWKRYLQELLDQFELLSHSPWRERTYTRILVEEGMFARLLEHVRKAPYRIETFYQQLLPHYPEEVKALFVAHIESMVDQSRNRRNYAGVCRIIRLLHQIGGRQEAIAVTQKLMDKYPQRPAFQDELRKIRFK